MGDRAMAGRRGHPGTGWPESGLEVQAAVVVAAVRLGLWLLPLRSLHRWLGRLARLPRAPWEIGSPDRVARAVTRASRWVPRATCLTQALAVRALLDRRGHPASVRIGVGRSRDGRLEGHAWVESGGRIVAGATELARHPPLCLLGPEVIE